MYHEVMAEHGVSAGEPELGNLDLITLVIEEDSDSFRPGCPSEFRHEACLLIPAPGYPGPFTPAGKASHEQNYNPRNWLMC